MDRRESQNTSRAYRSSSAVIGVIALVAVAALGVGVALAIGLRGPEPDVPAGRGSARPSASASPAASPAPRAEESRAAPSETRSPEASQALANRAIAEVAVDALNFRAAPGQDSEILGELGRGARVFTIGGPHEADGIRWYRVAYVDGPHSACTEIGRCWNEIGWIADAGGADPWLVPVEISCPSRRMFAEQLATLVPLERLHCYGDEPITVTGAVDYPYTGLEGPIGYEPFWLAAPVTEFVFDETAIWLRSEQALDLEPGDVVRATLAMEHPHAARCRVFVMAGFFEAMGQTPPPVEEMGLRDQASMVLGCRTELVVDSLEVIGTQPVSP